MEITISLEQVFLVLIAIGALVAIVYLIILLKNLVETIKRTNKVLDDVQAVSTIDGISASLFVNISWIHLSSTEYSC